VRINGKIKAKNPFVYICSMAKKKKRNSLPGAVKKEATHIILYTNAHGNEKVFNEYESLALAKADFNKLKEQMKDTGTVKGDELTQPIAGGTCKYEIIKLY
jgi:hypothetical protein